MPVNPDLLIIGGGVVGSACARELARAGLEVTVVDPGGTTGQGWQAAAGLLTPQVETGEDSPLLEIGLAGREYYVTNREELEEVSGVTLGLELGGVTNLAFTESQADRLKEIVAWQRQHGLYCNWLSPEEVEEQWPWLTRTAGALFAPADGSLNPVRLVEALIADGERQGVRRVADRITGLVSEGGRVTGARGANEYRAGMVLIAAGAWSGRLEALPRPISVEPVRGQMIALPRPEGLNDFASFGDGYYLLTRGDEILAGASIEHAGFSAEVTDAVLTRIHQAAIRICPALGEAKVARSWAGLHPGTPDGLPVIGKEPLMEGLWYATGHGRSGVLLAGITGVVLQQMMAAEATLESVSAFRPERFWNR